LVDFAVVVLASCWSQSLPITVTEDLPERYGYGIFGESIHQSNFESSGGWDFFCGNEKFQSLALPDQAWQALRASPSGHKTEGGAAVSENGVGSGDPAVTGEREIKASAHTVAFDGGNDGGGIAGDCVHERLSHGGELIGLGAAEGSDFIQVGADRKKLAIARDDEWAECLFRFAANGGGQCQHASAGKAVSAIRRSEAKDARRAVDLDSEEERRHGNMMHY